MGRMKRTGFRRVTVRRELRPNDPGFTSRQQLEEAAKITDAVLTQHQRVPNCLGGPKTPDALTVQVDQAETLRGILEVMTGTYNVMRYQVVTHTFTIRFASVTQSLIMSSRRAWYLWIVPPGSTPPPRENLSDSSATDLSIVRRYSESPQPSSDGSLSPGHGLPPPPVFRVGDEDEDMDE